jgi:hypothetical protein
MRERFRAGAATPRPSIVQAVPLQALSRRLLAPVYGIDWAGNLLPDGNTRRCRPQFYGVTYCGSCTIFIGQGLLIGPVAIFYGRPWVERYRVEEVVPAQHRKRSIVLDKTARVIREICGIRLRYADSCKRNRCWSSVRNRQVLRSRKTKRVGTKVQRFGRSGYYAGKGFYREVPRFF